MDVYAPLDVPRPIGDALWVVDGPVVRLSIVGFAVPFPTRMVIVRLANRDLFVWSPIELSPLLRERVDALGRVRHLVSPNKLHYTHIAAWKAAYPGAIAWASRGVRERAASRDASVAFDRELAAAPDSAWASEIDQLVFRGSRAFEETVFFHRATRTLILADLIENFEPAKLTLLERIMARLGGVCDPDGRAPSDLRATFLGHRDLARESLARLLAWQPQRVVIAHGRWYEHNAEVELRRAFRWLN
jgi:hypothetical protein